MSNIKNKKLIVFSLVALLLLTAIFPIISAIPKTAKADTTNVAPLANDGKLHIKINNQTSNITENVSNVGETNYLTVDASLDGSSDIPLSYEWEIKGLEYRLFNGYEKCLKNVSYNVFNDSSYLVIQSIYDNTKLPAEYENVKEAMIGFFSFDYFCNYSLNHLPFGQSGAPSYTRYYGFSNVPYVYKSNNYDYSVIKDSTSVIKFKNNLGEFVENYSFDTKSNKLNLAGLNIGSYTLRCKISHPNADTVYTSEVTANIVNKPTLSFAINNTSKTVYLDESFSLNITGQVNNPFDNSLNFQWYLNNSIVSGATTASYDVKTLPVGTHNLKCKISSNYANDLELSSIVTIKNRPTITVTTQPQSKPIVWKGVGDKISVETTLTHSLTESQVVNYQWYKGETIMVGQTTKILDLSAQNLDVGNYAFKCKMSTTDGFDVISSVANIEVKKLKIIINQQPQNIRMVVGTEMKLTTGISLASDVENVSYKWVVNNIALDYENSDTLDLSKFDKGNYEIYCEVTADQEVVRSDKSFVEVAGRINQTIIILIIVVVILVAIAIVVLEILRRKN